MLQLKDGNLFALAVSKDPFSLAQHITQLSSLVSIFTSNFTVPDKSTMQAITISPSSQSTTIYVFYAGHATLHQAFLAYMSNPQALARSCMQQKYVPLAASWFSAASLLKHLC